MKAIAIDGPAGAGKSTIAKQVSKELQFIYVDTGALYRAVGYTAMKKGVLLAQIEDILPLLEKMEVSIRYLGGAQHVFVDGEDVSEVIRSEEVAAYASRVSPLPKVRRFLFDLQRRLALENNVVMDGRDIGTVVLPDAGLKIFLTASVEERARRRCKELIEKGLSADFETVKAEIAARDEADMHREIAPLKKAADAVVIDSSDMTLDESVNAVLRLARERLSL